MNEIKRVVYIIYILLASGCTLYSASMSGIIIEKSKVIEVFDSADGPLTETLVEMIAGLIDDKKNSSSDIAEQQVTVDQNICTLTKKIESSKNYTYETQFVFTYLPIVHDEYDSLKGTLHIVDCFESVDHCFCSIKAEFDFTGRGGLKTISFRFDNHGVCTILVNDIDMTTELKCYFSTQASKYINLSKNVLSSN